MTAGIEVEGSANGEVKVVVADEAKSLANRLWDAAADVEG